MKEKILSFNEPEEMGLADDEYMDGDDFDDSMEELDYDEDEEEY